MSNERDRIQFVIDRGGYCEAVKWAKRVLNAYETGVRNPNSHIGKAGKYQLSATESIKELKKFIELSITTQCQERNYQQR